MIFCRTACRWGVYDLPVQQIATEDRVFLPWSKERRMNENRDLNQREERGNRQSLGA